MTAEPVDGRCTRCGAAIDAEDGFRLFETAGSGKAAFCRLEHVIPWAIQGADWESGAFREPPPSADLPDQCAHCGQPLPEDALLLVRHRAGHRIPDEFCSIDHLLAWAKAGGRWQ